jgi:preprotein translocase subunit SecG
MGGQSAFGTKAGDLFTKITIGVATFWILLCILSINVLGTQQSLFSTNLGAAAPESMEGLGTTEAMPAEIAPDPANDPSETPGDTGESDPATTEEKSSSGSPEPTNDSPTNASPEPASAAEKSAE